MNEEIDKEKLDKMWKNIITYEKNNGITDSKKIAINEIIKIIDEVYRECY